MLYLDQVLNSPTIRSTLTPFGLFVDFPVYHNSERTLEERVLFLGVPNNFYDPQSTLIYSMVWHTITASLSELHRTSVEARFDRLRGWCLFSIDVHRVSLNYGYLTWDFYVYATDRGRHHRLCLGYVAAEHADLLRRTPRHGPALRRRSPELCPPTQTVTRFCRNGPYHIEFPEHYT